MWCLVCQKRELPPKMCSLHQAAPDLLAALEGVMGELDEVSMTCGDRCRLCQGENDTIGQLQHTLDCPLTVARAAIAKAKGGA